MICSSVEGFYLNSLISQLLHHALTVCYNYNFLKSEIKKVNLNPDL